MTGVLALAFAAGLPTGPSPPPGQLSELLSLRGRLHALALIDKNLILPPWPYKAWFPSPESLAGPLTFLISCSCLFLWCCFGRGQGGHGEWKHLAGQTVSALCLVSPQALALACCCYLWPLAQGAAEGLPVGAVRQWPFSAGRFFPCVPGCSSLELLQESWLLYPCPSFAGWCLVHRYLEMGSKGGCGARVGGHAELGVVPQLPRPV